MMGAFLHSAAVSHPLIQLDMDSIVSVIYSEIINKMALTQRTMDKNGIGIAQNN